MAGLNDIPAAFLAVKADIETGAYAQAVKDLCVGLTAAADFAQSIGFKAKPSDAKTIGEVEAACQGCIAACNADHKVAAAGTRDWKALLLSMLTAFLSWWATPPVA